jgi:Holliday junction resolvase RusA-like endonuclease
MATVWPDLAKDQAAFEQAKRELPRGSSVSDIARLAQSIKTAVKGLTFSLPFLPPSVNHFKTRRFYNSKETWAFIEAVCVLSGKQRVAGEFYAVEMTYYIPEREFLRWDTNNFWKVALDALSAAGVIRDDRYVVDERARKLLAPDGEAQTEYKITGMEAQ